MTRSASRSCSSGRLADREPPELRADVLLEALVRHKVQFVTVGGFAGRLHGASRMTKDLDICPAWDRETSSCFHVIGFRELQERATELELHDGTVLVAALEDLIRSKEHPAWRNGLRGPHGSLTSD